MRTTVFAFMGLMAAGGLALVAIFAQLGFPLLEPAPLPSDPARADAVAGAKVVAVNPGRRAPDQVERSGAGVSSPDSDAARSVIPADSAGSGPSGGAGSPRPEGSTGVAPPAGVGAGPATPKAVSPPAPPAPEGAPAPPPTSSSAPAPAPSPPAEAPLPPPAPPAPQPEASTAGGPPPHSNAGGNGNGKALGLSK